MRASRRQRERDIGTETRVERSDTGAVLAELRGVGRDREVAENVQNVATADSQSVDRGDDRLRASRITR